MNYLPIAINIDSQPILIIGGGKVALKKLEGLSRYTRQIKVIAPDICQAIKAKVWVEIEERNYETSDLQNYLLVYAATDNPQVNAQVFNDAKNKRCLVNVVDNPELSAFASPAIFKKDDISVAVSSNGNDVRQAIQWRNDIEKLAGEGMIGTSQKPD